MKGATVSRVVVDTYRRTLRQLLQWLQFEDSIERKVLTAAVIQYVAAMLLLVFPLAFLGPTRVLTAMPTGYVVGTAVVVCLVTLAFANTVWVVRRDLLTPVLELQDVTEALAVGHLDQAQTDPTQTDEIETLQSAIRNVHQHLLVVTEQTNTLGQEECSAPILEEEIPGQLGSSLETM
ncbi:HAMP domain-containing protein [Natronobacterium gregoryi]|uniref:HAMP domain-containing protein n=2 Tax=Natronobacterium gregoryi TaxID=44930 RepID=L0AL31_NATGS|nr:HAMP domain-containing protein [Natronobacterium gregoryi]AFZ74511.1 HAMP domain-containing protein [Natronobacterium gregoryi SP2]ELY72415.1 methyl-accepting chemotaxis sensory transducer [Natronobacterium gregoryi SP2]PLK21743.1 HAMP domain-containing protein [Natronobacterium gregoryi SP2]SFI97858.1 HAMP domain-containing protein [Natronobacterium gregoryi]